MNNEQSCIKHLRSLVCPWLEEEHASVTKLLHEESKNEKHSEKLREAMWQAVEVLDHVHEACDGLIPPPPDPDPGPIEHDPRVEDSLRREEAKLTKETP